MACYLRGQFNRSEAAVLNQISRVMSGDLHALRRLLIEATLKILHGNTQNSENSKKRVKLCDEIAQKQRKKERNRRGRVGSVQYTEHRATTRLAMGDSAAMESVRLPEGERDKSPNSSSSPWKEVRRESAQDESFTRSSSRSLVLLIIRVIAIAASSPLPFVSSPLRSDLSPRKPSRS